VRLVDTSAWIEIFAKPPRVDVKAVVPDPDEVVTCLPVIQEVLQGFDDEPAFRVARTAMYALPSVESPLTAAVVDAAVDIYRRARRAGVTVRSGADCLIAACAIRHSLTVVHCDRDFPAIARIFPLAQIDIGPMVGRSSRHAARLQSL
jgi:hypothetical protein